MPPFQRRAFAAPAIVALLLCLPAKVTLASAEDALWAALRDGAAVAIMRHALAPGTGDPVEFDLEDCATQRNLSDEGRGQARAIGARFRAAGILSARVSSSLWCRCRETAELLDLGAVEPLPALNSFFQEREKEPAATRALRAFLAALPSGPPVVLVTHQVNITALTGVYPGSGEIVVIRPSRGGEVEVLGRIRPE